MDNFQATKATPKTGKTTHDDQMQSKAADNDDDDTNDDENTDMNPPDAEKGNLKAKPGKAAPTKGKSSSKRSGR